MKKGVGGRQQRGKGGQTVIIPKSESSVRVPSNSFMPSGRKHTEESVSHFRGNTGSRACSVQGEQERVGERREEREQQERESIVAFIPHPLS